jgi:haloalkane dehalogenase
VAIDSIRSHYVAIKGSQMHYLEAGSGAPLVFLHGNPTSSFLWRKILPRLAPLGRCIALDYIGMGQSDKPSIAYRLVDHISYVEAFLDALALRDATFVTHDWGVVIGLTLGRQRPELIRGIVLMEGHIHPIAGWDALDAGAQALFQQLRTDGLGQELAIEQNIFIEVVLPSGMHHTLTPHEMETYRAPYREKQARLPLWRWANEIPIQGQPADVHAMVSANQVYLATTNVPKLLLYGQPGAVIGAAEVAWCLRECPGLTASNIGPGIHFLPEDQPDVISAAIAAWYRRALRA